MYDRATRLEFDAHKKPRPSKMVHILGINLPDNQFARVSIHLSIGFEGLIRLPSSL